MPLHLELDRLVDLLEVRKREVNHPVRRKLSWNRRENRLRGEIVFLKELEQRLGRRAFLPQGFVQHDRLFEETDQLEVVTMPFDLRHLDRVTPDVDS